MRTVKVPLGTRSYNIRIGNDLLKQIGPQCARLKLGARCAVISDSNVAPRYAKLVLGSLSRAGFDPVAIDIVAGEKSKNLRSMEQCFNAFAKHRLERKSFVVALGGGVVGDLAGFVAASYLRGVQFVQVPTTLLAQVDSSVGGKTGINLRAGKNLVGAFHQPELVLCDLDSLKTLPQRELRAGLAEIIKYGIIYDARFFRWLENNLDALLKRNPGALAHAVAVSCRIKAAVVGEDEKEGGLRAILNFGHTIGHAIEAITAYGTYLHGEAISIGQVKAARLSCQLHGLPVTAAYRIETLFKRTGLPIDIKLSTSQRRKLFAAMQLDKKVSAGSVKFVLADKIGHVDYGLTVSDKALNSVL
jgi:3-dehydroquinate synthase